jgi:hypothetical protein
LPNDRQGNFAAKAMRIAILHDGIQGILQRAGATTTANAKVFEKWMLAPILQG